MLFSWWAATQGAALQIHFVQGPGSFLPTPHYQPPTQPPFFFPFSLPETHGRVMHSEHRRNTSQRELRQIK